MRTSEHGRRSKPVIGAYLMVLAVVLGLAGATVPWFEPRFAVTDRYGTHVASIRAVYAGNGSKIVALSLAFALVVLVLAALSTSRLAAGIAAVSAWKHCLAAGVVGLLLVFQGLYRVSDLLTVGVLLNSDSHIASERNPQPGLFLWLASAVLCLIAALLTSRARDMGAPGGR